MCWGWLVDQFSKAVLTQRYLESVTPRPLPPMAPPLYPPNPECLMAKFLEVMRLNQLRECQERHKRELVELMAFCEMTQPHQLNQPKPRLP